MIFHKSMSIYYADIIKSAPKIFYTRIHHASHISHQPSATTHKSSSSSSPQPATPYTSIIIILTTSSIWNYTTNTHQHFIPWFYHFAWMTTDQRGITLSNTDTSSIRIRLYCRMEWNKYMERRNYYFQLYNHRYVYIARLLLMFAFSLSVCSFYSMLYYVMWKKWNDLFNEGKDQNEYYEVALKKRQTHTHSHAHPFFIKLNW